MQQKKAKIKKQLRDQGEIKDILENLDHYSFNFDKVYHKAIKRSRKSVHRLKRPLREVMDERI